MSQWMIYGANGYTGALTARLAVERGHSPILAGRSAGPLTALAEELGLESRVFSLGDPAEVARGLAGIDAVVHAAGPFSATSRPMVDGCLATGTHYLDITGEIDVFEAVFTRDAEAKAAGVTLLPGAGFDVVPTDCLAAMLAQRLPNATHLELAFAGGGRSSQGTAKTSVERLGVGGAARIDGEMRIVPHAWRSRLIPFPGGEQLGVTIPWGDVSTAYRSTGIPNILVYMAVTKGMKRMMGAIRVIRPLFKLRVVQSLLKKIIARRVQGPDEAMRKSARSLIWGEVRAEDGSKVSGTLVTPEGYTLTADSCIRAVEKILSGGVAAGALTPSLAFGPEFVTECDNVDLNLPG